MTPLENYIEELLADEEDWEMFATDFQEITGQETTDASALPSRREVLHVATLGTAGLMALPFFEPQAEAQAQLAWSVLPWVWELAEGVGIGLLTNYLYDYMKQSPPWLQQQIKEVNKDMEGGGFKIKQQSKVLGDNRPNGRFMYPALRPDGNTCVAIHLKQQAQSRDSVPKIEGPTVVGLSATTKRIKQRVQETKNLTDAQVKKLAHNILLPKTAVQPAGSNSFKDSYATPGVWTTTAGKVTVTYNVKNGKKLGTVNVAAERINPKGLLWQEDVDLNGLV